MSDSNLFARGLAFALTALPGAAHADTVAWIDGSGFWDIAGNWDPGIPTAVDDVSIDVVGTRTVTVRATGGPFAVNTLTAGGDETLALSNASLTINAASSLYRLSVAGSSGILTLNAPLTVADTFTHGSGLISGSDLTLGGPANLAFSAFGAMTGNGTTRLQGAATIGTYRLDAGRLLRNEGDVTLTGSIDLNYNSGAGAGAGRIENAAGAMIDVRTFNLSVFASNQGAADDGSDGRFDNAGTLLKSTGNTYFIGVPFNNSGVVQTDAGAFSFSGGGSQSGSFNAQSGTTIGFTDGAHAIESGASFTGLGTVSLTGAATVLQLNAATTIDSGFDHGSGTVQGGDLTLNGPTTLALSGYGVMTGNAVTHLNNATTIAAYALDANRVLRNAGTVSLVGGIELNRTSATGAGRIENAPQALFDIRTFNQSIVATAQTAVDTGSDALFINEGTLRRSTTGNSYTIAVALDNRAGATIDVALGTLNLAADSNHSGAVTVATGTTLGMTAGTHYVNAGATFHGAGTLALAGAGTTLYLNAPAVFDAAFSMTGGTIQGADLTLAGNNNITISSSLGVMAGPGTTTLRGDSLLSGGVNNRLGLDGGRVLRNEGYATVTGVLDLNRLNTPGAGSGIIENAANGTIDIKTFNQGITATDWGVADNGSDARIDNAGIFRKSTAGNYTIAVQFNNTGTVDVQAGQLTFLSTSNNGGTFSIGAGGTMTVGPGNFANQGTLQGNGTLFLAPGTVLTNSGTVAPGNSAGTLHLDGDFVQDADGIFEVELQSLTEFDRLLVNGNGSLGGTLRISNLFGYLPDIGDTFTIASFDNGLVDGSDLSGEFNHVLWQGFTPGTGFSVTYTAHDIVLTAVISPVPIPLPLVLMGVPLACLLRAARHRRLKKFGVSVRIQRPGSE
ncbi:MAG: hypothetical protein H6978_08950 [Gammaproteobacteria bacterium]|nr:hypothetical protein [Gammaproteobacteria bacterium]